MRRPLLAAMLLSLASCGADDLSFAPPETFTPGGQAALTRASSTWNGVTVPAKTLSWSTDGSWRVLSEDPHNGYGGLTRWSERTVLITPNIAESDVYAVAMHEFGHVLGLRHLKDGESGVMAAPRGDVEFSDEDIVECRRVGACP